MQVMQAMWILVKSITGYIHTSHDPRRSAHTKLGYTRKEFARYAFNKGTIELVFVPTADQLANG